MRISLNSAIVLILAIAISAGVLLFPARVSGTNILKDCQVKAIDPADEPNIQVGGPGYDPAINTGTLGSSQGTSIDTRRPDLLQDYNRETRKARSRYMQLLFFYLRNFTHGPFRH